LYNNDFIVDIREENESQIFHLMHRRTVRSVSNDFEQTSLLCLFYFISVLPLSTSCLCYKVAYTRRLLSALRKKSIWTLHRP